MRLLPCTLAVLLLALAGPSGAATISMTADKTTYGIGETILLTITGDSQGAIAGDSVHVIVKHDPTRVMAQGGSGGLPDLFTQFNGTVSPVRGNYEEVCSWAPGRDDQCLTFDQLMSAPTYPADPGDRTSVLQYTVIGSGPIAFTFQDQEVGDFYFFDLASAPAGISVLAVPEPSTGALMALGMVALAAWRRGTRV